MTNKIRVSVYIDRGIWEKVLDMRWTERVSASQIVERVLTGVVECGDKNKRIELSGGTRVDFEETDGEKLEGHPDSDPVEVMPNLTDTRLDFRPYSKDDQLKKRK